MLLLNDVVQGFQDFLLKHDFDDLVGCQCDAVVEEDRDFLAERSDGLG